MSVRNPTAFFDVVTAGVARRHRRPSFGTGFAFIKHAVNEALRTFAGGDLSKRLQFGRNYLHIYIRRIACSHASQRNI